MLQLLSVEGPSVSMETFYVEFGKGVTTYSVSVILEGSSFLPVTATLNISQRKLTSRGTVRNGVVVYQVGDHNLPNRIRHLGLHCEAAVTLVCGLSGDLVTLKDIVVMDAHMTVMHCNVVLPTLQHILTICPEASITRAVF